MALKVATTNWLPSAETPESVQVPKLPIGSGGLATQLHSPTVASQVSLLPEPSATGTASKPGSHSVASQAAGRSRQAPVALQQ